MVLLIYSILNYPDFTSSMITILVNGINPMTYSFLSYTTSNVKEYKKSY